MNRKQKNSLFHQLLAKAGIREHKEAVLEGYNVASVTDLTDDQIDGVLNRLSIMPELKKNNDATPAVRRGRSNVIMAVEDYYNINIKSAKSWTQLNNLMMDKRIMGKMLWEMSEAELKTVTAKLKTMTRKNSGRIQADNILAQNN
jgi:hypothetical protein